MEKDLVTVDVFSIFLSKTTTNTKEWKLSKINKCLLKCVFTELIDFFLCYDLEKKNKRDWRKEWFSNQEFFFDHEWVPEKIRILLLSLPFTLLSQDKNIISWNTLKKVALL